MYDSTFLSQALSTLFPIEYVTQSGMWFCFIFFFLFLEMGHPGLLYFLSFSCGALCSFAATLYGINVVGQLLLFIIGTCLALCMLHYFLKATIEQLQIPSHRSNTEALIGKKVIVIQAEHDATIFQARITGQLWLIRPVQDQILKAGQQVIIVDVQGCHLRVDASK